MKKDTHPEYQDVLFIDSSTGTKFVCGSTLQPEEREKHEGKEYPMHRISVSSASHPFFTGSSQLIDTEGRIDKFKKRYQTKMDKMKKDKEESQEELPPAPKKKKAPAKKKDSKKQK